MSSDVALDYWNEKRCYYVNLISPIDAIEEKPLQKLVDDLLRCSNLFLCGLN